jgi:glycosyltransferase involved in cell wall biosynthesis
LILPSLSEGHPVSLVEAMVAGVPAIATQVGGAPEIIQPGVTGWLIDPLSEESIETAIEELMNASPARLEDLTRRAREYALAHFSPAYYFQQLSELYTSAL